MFQSSNPVLEFIWYMLIIYFWFMVIMIYVQIIWDILRRENLSGWGKAGWILLLLVAPFIGALIYVIARPKNTDQDKRDREAALAAQARLQGGSAVDDLVHHEPELRVMARRIIELQERLRALVDDEGWRAYLDAEAASNARLSAVGLLVARWAYREGRRSRGRP